MNGWFLFYKPENISSAGALNFIKRLFKNLGFKHLKIGHAGTLDPFADGLLLVAIGEATKTINYVMDASKVYEFSICWGENRDTLDREGQVTATSTIIPSKESIEKVLEDFIGEIEQVPPQFSAILLEGKRAYQLARDNIDFTLKPRKVLLHELSVLVHEGNITKFRVKCGKGFYVRSLARDIAEKLGACGYVCTLRRVESKKFNLVDAISLDKIKNLLHNVDLNNSLQYIEENLKPIASVLDDILVQNVNEAEAKKLKHGQAIDIETKLQENSQIAVFNDSKLIAICKFENRQLKPIRVFNL
jgi:tRNA pseudouridine55 synthase